jgi:hypothetical protein
MAKGADALFLNDREVNYAGGRVWNEAFPNGVQWVASPLPDGTDLGKGFIPASTGPNTNPNNGGSPYIDPTTGKKFPGAPG